MRETLALSVSESSQVGEARRVASSMAARAGFDETGRGKVALLATELAGNLVQHAQGGELIVSGTRMGSTDGIELLAIDKGPGMADFRRCLADGFSTAGTPGNGLGAVARMSHELDVHSVPGEGTVMVCRLWATPRPGNPPPSGPEVGAVCLPLAGETACGDSWEIVHPTPGRTLLMIADGLGHGPRAADASLAAIEAFRRSGGDGPAGVLRVVHEALRGTRGAAVAVAAIDHDRREVLYAGVGNIFGMILAPGSRSGLVSHNGTLGGEARKFQEFAYPWPESSVLVMHSDGLATHWRLDRASSLASRHPAVIAGSLYRDFTRGRDDATVVVVRDGGATSA